MFTQGMKKNRAFVSLIVFGVISILFSPLSSIMAFAGIGIVSIIIGWIMYMRSMNKHLSGKSISGIFVLLVSIAIFPFGCTVKVLKVPMIPDVGKIEIKGKLPIEAGLLITEETKNYIFKGHPESFTGGGRPHEFPLGEALERSSVQTFSQVFQKVTLVRTSTETKSYKIFIEPKIEDFHFRYDPLIYVNSAYFLSKIKVRVTLASGETKVWEKSIESPEQKKGPRFLSPGYEKELGESASEALNFTLRKIALEITEDVSIRQFIQR